MAAADRQAADAPPPRWLWRAALGGVALVIALVALAAVALGRGAADPPVAGPVTWSDRAFAWAGASRATLAPGAAHWWAAPEPLPLRGGDAAFTLAVRARLDAAADPLAAWGVWIAAADGTRTVYAISAGGYWTIRTCSPGSMPQVIEDCPAAHPDWRWRSFPRIDPPGTANTVTVHYTPAGGTARLRVNEERLGAPAFMPGDAWGVWVQGGAEPATLTWEYATLAAPR